MDNSELGTTKLLNVHAASKWTWIYFETKAYMQLLADEIQQ